MAAEQPTTFALNVHQWWMVSSNLRRIREGVAAETQLSILRANGYLKIASAVEAIIKNKSVGQSAVASLRAAGCDSIAKGLEDALGE